MMYPYTTLKNEIEIVHSNIYPDGTVKVYIEKPIDGGFAHATILLPANECVDVSNFSDDELILIRNFVKQHTADIIKRSREYKRKPTSQNTKTLDEYLSFPYKMEIVPDIDEGGFVVSFPDLPGCISTGTTAEQAIANMADAKREWFTAAMEDGIMISEPS